MEWWKMASTPRVSLPWLRSFSALHIQEEHEPPGELVLWELIADAVGESGSNFVSSNDELNEFMYTKLLKILLFLEFEGVGCQSSRATFEVWYISNYFVFANANLISLQDILGYHCRKLGKVNLQGAEFA
ncbi:unnamed protein product [Ceratitis capitata]|uniref:(Mediterranean fruit fly) hypothetical protein n=1 Tax=Ceratitis capitata TaxID=7213 RepID=A0A811VI95_CERCA|nr:unnamed protein product [Ceratitis capitata]